jgi:hypothetical protein
VENPRERILGNVATPSDAHPLALTIGNMIVKAPFPFLEIPRLVNVTGLHSLPILSNYASTEGPGSIQVIIRAPGVAHERSTTTTPGPPPERNFGSTNALSSR